MTPKRPLTVLSAFPARLSLLFSPSYINRPVDFLSVVDIYHRSRYSGLVTSHLLTLILQFPVLCISSAYLIPPKKVKVRCRYTYTKTGNSTTPILGLVGYVVITGFAPLVISCPILSIMSVIFISSK